MTAMFYCLTISLSPFLSKFVTKNEYSAFLILILASLVGRVLLDNLIRLRTIVLVSNIMIFIFLQFLICDIASVQLLLGFYRLLIIPLTAYYSLIYMKLNGKKISDVFIPYFIVNLLILYYRAFVDYSFFGSLTMFGGFEHLYSAGGALYRPSNLTSPIIFSVELAVFLGVLFHEQGGSPKTFLLTASSILPFALMRSRSGLMLLLFLFSIKFLSRRKVRTVLLAISFRYLILVKAVISRERIQLWNLCRP